MDVENFIKSLTLLCVEDNKTTQFFYTSIFEDKINNIILADDGQDGYEKYLNNKVDIIISDYFMPNLNGLEMIEKIRLTDNEIPIILVSDIEDVSVIIKALHLNVNNFLKKPLIPDEIMQIIENASKLLIADNYIEEQKNKRIKDLQEIKEYNSYQENLAFSKELNILRNDFYYQMIDMDCTALIDFYYKPLDVISGDAYSVRKVSDTITFYLIVDGMGKGLSASLSAMLLTTYTNHIIDMMIKTNSFDLQQLIDSSLEYIKPILLEEEALSVDFITLNCNNHEMQYAKFAMPPLLMQDFDGSIIKLKSNEQPISKYINSFILSTYDTSTINKFLFYSDGIVENSTIYPHTLYSSFIEEDFKNSFTKEDMANGFLKKIDSQEDDVTFIFLNKLDLEKSILYSKSFDSSLEVLDIANDWYSEAWSEIPSDIKISYSAGLVFTELLMNAYEHGNLGLSAQEKHKLIEDDIYFETLLKLEKKCEKKIHVCINKIPYNNVIYIITQISDSGLGFDTNILTKIFRDKDSFNGRGIFVSKSSSSGIYYNSIGNSVLFIHKINED